MEFYGRTKFSLKIISQEGMHFRTTKPKSKDVWSLWINTTAEMCFMHCIVAAYWAPNLASLIKKKLGRADKYMTSSLERSAYDLRSSTNTIYGSSRCGPFHFPELLTFFFLLRERVWISRRSIRGDLSWHWHAHASLLGRDFSGGVDVHDDPWW